ncbi:hypothetical protein ACFVXC_33910 [Streptomyces sp. NPDC058257]|uniref:hypothetical protein n=1 Tax=Streptomyces sp. NPDC058257 TaxID=3346409 RepID=UPI0036E8250D
MGARSEHRAPAGAAPAPSYVRRSAPAYVRRSAPALAGRAAEWSPPPPPGVPLPRLRGRPGTHPCAVVVLVGAAALGGASFGLLLVLAYGAGRAVTLTAAGFLVVRVGSLAVRRVRGPRWPHRVTHRFLPLGSACVVFALGCGLVFKGAATALG